MMEREKMAYELTRYPEIYRRFYWGAAKPGGYGDSLVVRNRNIFAAAYKLAQGVDVGWRGGNSDSLDHLEFYETETRDLLILSSPYGDCRETLIRNGFLPTLPLYLQEVVTYVCRVPYTPYRTKRLAVDILRKVAAADEYRWRLRHG